MSGSRVVGAVCCNSRWAIWVLTEANNSDSEMSKASQMAASSSEEASL